MADGTVDNVAKIKVKFEADKESLAKIKDNWKEFSEEVAKVKSSGSKPTFVNMKNEIIELNQLFKEFNTTVGDIPKGNITSVVDEMKKVREVSQQIKTINKNNKGSNSNEFKNYQSALSKLENEAAKLNRQLKQTDDISKKIALRTQLNGIRDEYRKLNAESAAFRKEIGIQWSRGFFDLNNSIDYFKSKIRSKFTMMSAERLMDFAFTAPGELVNSLSQLEQAKVNFAQVMPNSFTDNQRAMNDAMKEFIQVAADYGASVNDVTEAGRLWGRQYKDVGIVQELVRSSTKLSITDNMSLVEVNKALEATMQQYGIKLKDANEAQQVSGDIVDKWSHLADTAVVTAADLATANEQSAGAAHQAGLSFDFLQGIISTMATRTGKSGAEVGRSVRSMLVSMNTAKARKEFEALGIALETVDNNGVKHVRNMEQVIVELMQKLKDSNKDIRDTVLAMSGGKFQYNNVLAFLTAYDEFQKNLNLSKNSSGWANEQVKLQYETIDKQIVALKADLQELVRILSETGATEGIRDLIGMLRSFIQVMQQVDPSKLSSIANVIKAIILWRVGLKAVALVLGSLPLKIDLFTGSLRTSIGVIQAAGFSLRGFAAAATLASKALGVIGLIISVMQVAMTVFDAFRESANNTKIEEAFGSARVYSEKKKALEELKAAQESYDEISANSLSTEEEKIKANERVKEAIQNLIPLLDEEGRARLENAGYSKQAIETEIDALKKKLLQQNASAIATKQFEVEQTKAVISGTLDRISSYQKEIEALKLLIAARSVSAANIRKAGFFGSDFIADNIEGQNEMYKEKVAELEKAIENSRKDYNKDMQKLENLNKDLERLQGNLPKGSTVGSNALGTSSPDREAAEKNGNNKGKGTASGGDNYAAKANLLKYQKQKNELWYDGKIAAQKYSNELKNINYLEEINGNSAETSGRKFDLYNARVKELVDYKDKLSDFRKELEKVLDAKMEETPELAKQLNYTKDLTTEQKLRLMEVNKETYQEMKSFVDISKMISEVNSKIEDTESKLMDVNKVLAKTKLSMKPEDIYTRTAEQLKLQYESDVADRSGFNNNFYDYQNQVEQVKYLSDLYVAQMVRVNAQRENLNRNITQWSEKEFYDESTKLKQWELEAKQTMANIRQAKLDSTSGIREGLADVTTQLLFEGNSWKDIWKKLWQDLAKDAILSLLKVQHQASLLGLILQTLGLFGGGGGGSLISAGDGTSSALLNVPKVIKPSHTGSIVSAYPKMHSGGDVSGGRTGVVPKLKNDEVLRTLQVGEEVNSLADRRSNEILGAVAMKALDEKNQMPGNIQIFAMDSKSFAEYLNENAQVLLGVLAKHKALGK